MNLSDIDEAVMLRNHRKTAERLMEAAKSGAITCEIRHSGDRIDPFGVIEAQPVRDAIVAAAAAFISEKNAELTRLGVELPGEISAA